MVVAGLSYRERKIEREVQHLRQLHDSFETGFRSETKPNVPCRADNKRLSVTIQGAVQPPIMVNERAGDEAAGERIR
jgi:hypothetical protein